MQGSAYCEYVWSKEWPTTLDLPMFEATIGDVSLSANAFPDASIEFEIHSDGKSLAQARSASIRHLPKLLRLAFSWDLPNEFYVIVNGVRIADAFADSVPAELDVPESAVRKARDFSIENERALEARSAQSTSILTKADYVLWTPEEEREFLSSSVRSLRELTDALINGGSFHLYATLALIRSLVARGGRHFNPLLQRVAGRLGAPLIIYSPIPENDPIAAIGDIDIGLHIAHEKLSDEYAEIDLDVWLSVPAWVGRDKKRYTHNDLIRTLCDATGSHFDPGAPLKYREIEELVLYRGAYSSAGIIEYTISIGECICALAAGLLAKPI